MMIRKIVYVSSKKYLVRILTWFSTIIIICCCSLSFAQTTHCDPQLTPTPDHVGYVLRDDRCEGLYVSPVSVHGGLELISLTKGRLRYELKPGQCLTLKAASKGMEPSTIQVRAVATPLRTYYRMDTRLSPGQSLQWPVDEVLLPLQLTDSRLGIFAWSMTPAGKVFVPVQVNRSTSNDIYLLVRPTVGVQNVMWRLSSRRASQRSTTGWQDVASQALAGETIHISMPKGDRGLLDVEVAAVIENGGWTKLRIKVWHE